MFLIGGGGGVAGLQSYISTNFGVTFVQRQILEVTSLSTILNNKQVVYINGSSFTSYLLTDSTFANIVITPPFAPM